MESGIVYAVLAAASYSFYAVGLKPFKERLILFFWINSFAYLAYLGLYFVRNIILGHDLHPLQHLLHDFTFVNVPFYILMACVWTGSIVVLNHLLDTYEISLVMPVTEMSILFALAGYLALGAKFSWISFVSVLIVFVGAILSAFEKLSWKNPLGPLKKIPRILLIGGIIESILASASEWITFICTHKTAQTLGIHRWVNNLFLHIYKLPFSFHNPFYYNVGVRFFIVLIFFAYMVVLRGIRWEVLTVLRDRIWYITGMSVAFTGSVVFYHMAFALLEDKNVLTALGKISIPIILLIGHFALKEKITQPKIVGCAIILLGGLISLVA